MKLLWNDEDYSTLQKDFLDEREILSLIKATLFGKLEYEKLFEIYDYVLGNFSAKMFLNEKHSKEENYIYLKNLEV